jgi:hypothetical protein
MKKFIGVQLAIFFVTASLLYLYASSVFGASTAKVKDIKEKDIIELKLADSYKIWKAINRIEDLWYVHTTGEVREFEDSKSVINKLIPLVQPYPELYTLVVEMLKARKNDNITLFVAQKEKIMEILRPIWRNAIIVAREREQKMGWGEWVAEKIKTTMNNLYSYLVGTTKSKTKLTPVFDEHSSQYILKPVEQK